MPVHPLIPLDDQLCFGLYSNALLIRKLYQPLLKELGVTYPQYLVLLALWHNDKQSVSDLGHRLYLDSGTLTPLLKKLEALKLLTRTRAAHDERQVIIALTDKGIKLRSIATEFPGKLLCAMDAEPTEIGALVGNLKSLRRKLETASID